MTSQQNNDRRESRKLKAGDRVCWKGDAKNIGTIKGTSWSGFTIEWEDGDKTSVSHDDMGPISRRLVS